MAKADIATLIEALDRLAAAGFAVDSEWQSVHDICQMHEGEKPFDWAHALCHRIEGDEWNAGYWYRNAGKAKPAVSFSDEWASMRAEMTKQA